MMSRTIMFNLEIAPLPYNSAYTTLLSFCCYYSKTYCILLFSQCINEIINSVQSFLRPTRPLCPKKRKRVSVTSIAQTKMCTVGGPPFAMLCSRSCKKCWISGENMSKICDKNRSSYSITSFYGAIRILFECFLVYLILVPKLHIY